MGYLKVKIALKLFVENDGLQQCLAGMGRMLLSLRYYASTASITRM